MPRVFRHLLATTTLLACVATAGAAQPAFTERLKEDERTSTGVSALSDDQRAVLNNLVEREIRLAQQGNVTAFASDFSKRRSAPERAKAGIDKLSPEQVERLDTLVAEAIASRPVSVDYAETRAVSHADAVRGVAPKPILHGEVSFTVGTSGSGRNFYGGSVYVEQTDPQKGYSLGVGYSEFRGHLPYYDWDYFDRYGYGRYGYGPYGLPYGRLGWRY